MNDPIKYYWEKRIEKCREAFERNNFDVYTVGRLDEVKALILNEIMSKFDFESVSWWDSLSMLSSGIMEEIEYLPNDSRAIVGFDHNGQTPFSVP